jgi:hypothetical protein
MSRGPGASASQPAPVDTTAKQLFGQLMGRYERNRSLWQFMAWSFIVAETFSAAAWIAGVARAVSDDDTSSTDTVHQISSDSISNFPQLDAVATGDGGSDANGPASQAVATGVDVAQGVIDILAGPEAKHIGSGTSFVHAELGYPWEGLYGFGQGHGPGISVIGPLQGPTLTPFDPSTLGYFNGLKAFTEGLGFGDDPLGLANAAPGTSAGAVGVAIEFTENVFTPVAFWQSLDRLDPHVQPLTRDSVDVDWLVQLNGMKDGHVVEADQVMGFAQAEHSIARNYDGNSFGNVTNVVDGQDWSDTLWVKGNYYEFNTIIQVNVLWDNDKITFEDFQSAGASPGGLSIRSGDNHQTNTASIGAANDLLPPATDAHSGADGLHQLIMGGRTEASSAIQINTIVDLDDINFNVDQLLGDTLGSIDFASVYSAGHIQENRSTIISDNDGFAGGMTPGAFLQLQSKGPIQHVNGDYYEFNTIVQLNVISDADEIAESRSDTSAGQPGGVIASGGTLQFNSASLAKNDHYDDLFVGGRYSQYSLVLQVNAMQDDDKIIELRGIPGTGVPEIIDTGVNGGLGSDGDHATTVATPSMQDDHLMRGDLLS